MDATKLWLPNPKITITKDNSQENHSKDVITQKMDDIMDVFTDRTQMELVKVRWEEIQRVTSS